jgi:hypothetical protein
MTGAMQVASYPKLLAQLAGTAAPRGSAAALAEAIRRP